MRMLPVTFVLGFAVMLAEASCGGTTYSPSDSPGDGGAEGANGEGSTSEGGADSGVPDARADGAADSAADALPSTLDVVLVIDSLFQNCMPIVSPDPVSVQGNLKITNKSASAVGPITFKNGAFLNAMTLAQIATFKLDTTTPIIQPGATSQALVEKKAGTMVPAGGCQTLTCGAEFVVELAYTGPGVPAGAVVRAPATKNSCAF